MRRTEEKAAAGEPFFRAAGFPKPHLPWTAPKTFFNLDPPGSLTPKAEPALRDVPPIARQTELSGFAQPDSREASIRGYYAGASFTDAQVGILLDQLDRWKRWGNTGGAWSATTAFTSASTAASGQN